MSPGDPARKLQELRAAAGAGLLPEMVLFYGHRPASPPPGPGCLSQWWPAPFVVDGTTYPTAEHWMMVAKARLFEDEAAERVVLSSPDPRRAKAAGRAVRGFDQHRWDEASFAIVVAGNLAKFEQNAELGRFLASTGTAVLVEASPSDGIWGIRLDRHDPRARDPRQWRGQNRLGWALMEVRSRLSAERRSPRPGPAG